MNAAAVPSKRTTGCDVVSTTTVTEQASAESKLRELDALLDYQRALASYRAATMTQRK